MSDILKLQHISTKNALLDEIKRRYDYSERVEVGHIVRMQEAVLSDNTRSKKATDELAAKDEAIKAAIHYAAITSYAMDDPDPGVKEAYHALVKALKKVASL